MPEVPDEPLEPEVDEPLLPDVDEPLVDDGGVLFMPLVPLAPRHESELPVLPAPLVPLVDEPLPVPISVELEPAELEVPEVERSWLLVLCCWVFLDFCFFVSELCWPLVSCELVELLDCAATQALTNIAARITASFVFMAFSFCLWVHTVSWHSGTVTLRRA